MKRKRRPKRSGRAFSKARIPLPGKTQKRHGDRTKFRRSRESAKLRDEIAKTLLSEDRP